LLVLLDATDDLDARLLTDVVGQRERLGRHVPLEDDALDDARAVAHLEEVQLAARTLVVEPALQRDRFADVAAKIGDVRCSRGAHEPPITTTYLLASLAR